MRAPLVLTLENKFDLFCAVGHMSVKHLNTEAADPLYIHIDSHKAYKQRTLIALT